MENENMSIKEALHKAYQLGQESGEQLTTHYLLKVRNSILNTLIDDYRINKYFDTSSENEPCALNFVFENENYTLLIDKDYIAFFETYKSEKKLIKESIRTFTEDDLKREKAIKRIADILLKPVC